MIETVKLTQSGYLLNGVEAAYATSWTLKANVDAAADEAAVDAIVWA